MSKQGAVLGTVLAFVLATITPLAQAEITSIAGSAEAQVTEFRSGEQGDTDFASDSFPGTAVALPLQVIAQLLSGDYASNSDPNELAAAAVAAQFADPRTLAQANPEEFAIDLALNSVSETIAYQAHAMSQETRGVLLSRAELGLSASAADSANVNGQLFLDGALALFAAGASKDLTGAHVVLDVTVVQRVEGQADQTVFSGDVELRGAAAGDASIVAGGSFPTGRLLQVDLALTSTDFGVFHVLIIPSITINYTYPATADQPFTLEATVEVEAANIPGQVGVAAVLGTPIDRLNQVIALTEGTAVASKTITALNNERENPSGTPAFPQTPALLPACGLFGFESLLAVAGFAGLLGLNSARARRRG